MFSPFIGRHLLILAIVAGNFGLAVWLVIKTRRIFNQVGLGRAIIQRALSVAYAGAALVILLTAMVMFADMELSDKAKACWQVNRQWSKIQLGMTRAELVRLVGEPAEINFNDQFLYRVHPLTYTHAGVAFKNPNGRNGSNEPLDEHATIESKGPEEGTSWIPGDFDFYFRDQYYSLIQVLSMFGLILLALVSLIPRRKKSRGWESMPLYYPVLALLFGFVYESLERGGWRFDLFLLWPMYAVIVIAWIVRVTRQWRSASSTAQF